MIGERLCLHLVQLAVHAVELHEDLMRPRLHELTVPHAPAVTTVSRRIIPFMNEPRAARGGRQYSQDEIRVLREVAEAVRNKHHGLTLPHAAQRLEEVELAGRVHGGCGLVDDDQPRPGGLESHERPCTKEPLSAHMETEMKNGMKGAHAARRCFSPPTRRLVSKQGN